MDRILEMKKHWFDSGDSAVMMMDQSREDITVTSLVGTFRFTEDMRHDVGDYLFKLAVFIKDGGL